MEQRHPKAIRREILLFLYEYFQADPHGMATPDEFIQTGKFERDELPSNAFYLHERGLVEIMHGYAPPMFSVARITANGVDLVENERKFDQLFPESVQVESDNASEIPYLVERLAEEADLSALDGEQRNALQRDVRYLRAEFSRPENRWRYDVFATVLGWIDKYFDHAEENRLPAVALIREAVEKTRATRPPR